MTTPMSSGKHRDRNRAAAAALRYRRDWQALESSRSQKGRYRPIRGRIPERGPRCETPADTPKARTGHATNDPANVTFLVSLWRRHNSSVVRETCGDRYANKQRLRTEDCFRPFARGQSARDGG